MEVVKYKLSKPKGWIYTVWWIIYWGGTVIFFLKNLKTVYTPVEEGSALQLPFGIAVSAFLPFAIILCYWRWSHIIRKPYGGKEVRKRLGFAQIIWIILNSCFCFLVMEMINNPDLWQMKIYLMLANIAGISIMTVILMLFYNSWRKSVYTITVFFVVMSLIFCFVYSCRGEPFQLIDIYSFGTAVRMAKDYTFPVTWQVVDMLTAALALMGIYLHVPDWQLCFKKGPKLILRGAAAALMIIGYFVLFNTGWNTALGITTDLWAPIKTYKSSGTTVGFFCVTKFMKRKPPEGYSAAATEEIAKESVKDYETWSQTYEPLTGEKKPVNIICIMNETWADYRYVGDFETTNPYMEYYDSMEEDTIKGHTLVSIKGGGTSKSEYEFLTGNSVKQYAGMVPYVSYFTHDQYSMVSTLEAQGYYTVAMHPNKGTNWNRNAAYGFYGFDEFYTITDFGEDAEKIRGHISDKANYEKIIEVVEGKEHPDDPLFLFDVTMQNHGGYYSDSFRKEVDVVGIDNDTADRYLSLLRITDKALQYLIEYFKKCEEPTLIVMFGDHFPTMDEEFETFVAGMPVDEMPVEEQQKLYATPFFIWANYDIPEEKDVVTSLNFLGVTTLELSGVKLTDYQHYLQMLHEKIAAINSKCYILPDGTVTLWKNADADIRESVRQYECIQHNNLVEKHRRIDWFFALKQ
ncbi:MAG: sulfatase-like hydrolase/transferase [Eubacterium sp.]|nr:sulfatase-like hydrolase/transferase [Eubacterium sp.]